MKYYVIDYRVKKTSLSHISLSLSKQLNNIV